MSKSVQKEILIMVNRKENTRQAILKAMVSLLKTESFDDITTIKLAKMAGISRSSFYTHYKDKYEMIDYYQQTFFHKLEYIFEKEYRSIYLAHAFFGVCQSWIAKGKKESPQEMTQFVLKMLTST